MRCLILMPHKSTLELDFCRICVGLKGSPHLKKKKGFVFNRSGTKHKTKNRNPGNRFLNCYAKELNLVPLAYEAKLDFRPTASYIYIFSQ